MYTYPVYAPPHHDAENVLAKHEIKANYDYFLAEKTRRVHCLTEYFASFSIALRFERNSIEALDSWIYRYGGHLLPRKRQPRQGSVVSAMLDYQPAWTGVFRGLNIINDIGIFVGDYIVSKDPGVHWDVYYGNGTPRDYEEVGFGHPCLLGLRHIPKGEYYPILGLGEIFDYCRASWRRIKGSVDITWHRGELLRRVDHLASKQFGASEIDSEHR
jgi:hypothetical protein